MASDRIHLPPRIQRMATIIWDSDSMTVVFNLCIHPHCMNSRTRLAVLVAIIAIIVATAIALDPRPSDRNDSDQGNGHAFPNPIEEGDRDYLAASEAEESYAETIETLKSSLFDSSLSADDMAESIEAANAERLKMRDYYVWMYLDYCEKPAEFGDTYKAWTVLRTHLDDDLATALKESLFGPCAETVGKAMEACGLDPETYRNYDEMTQEETDFREKEADLIAEYDSIMFENYEMEYGGTVWTSESIMTDASLTRDQKNELLTMLEYKQGEDVVGIFIELVQIRNDYAVLNGYENYSEYAYEVVYGRDYTPTEAGSFSDILDVAWDVYNKMMGDDDSMMSFDRLDWLDSYEGDGFIDVVSPFIDSVSDEYAKLLDYMIEYDLIDIFSETGRVEAGFTRGLYTRGSAAIYVGYAGDTWLGSTTVRTIVHEFGHAANFCLNPNPSACQDIVEIHSQGLEALYCTSGLAGEGSRAFATEELAGLMYDSIMQTGWLTELELWAYETEAATDSLTADSVRDKYVSILEPYCGHEEASKNAYFWAQYPHLFKNPHYYISYGTSAIGAIELFVEASENYDAAKEKYLSLVFQQGIDGYSEAVKEAGLTNAFDADAVKAILNECIPALKRVEA